MDEEENSRSRVENFIENELQRKALSIGRRAVAIGGRSILAGSGAIVVPGVTAIILILILVPVIMFFTGIIGQASEVSKSVAPSKHFYCQYDPRWTDSTCTISGFGCDPTALATVMSSFGRLDLNPKSVAMQNGYMGCNSATTIAQIEDSIEWTKTQGFTVVRESLGFLRDFNIPLAKEYLDKGYLLLGVANVSFRTNSPIKSGGHSFVITGVDPTSQNLTVLDPTYCTSDESYDVRTLNVNDVLCDSGGCGWYYVHAIKKL